MKKTPDHVTRWRNNHHKALEALRAPGCTSTGLQIWRKLRRLETKAHQAATAYCNGETLRIGAKVYDYRLDEDCSDRFKSEQIIPAIKRIFGHVPQGFFWNTDARGYALKLESENVPEGMHQDWGRYGILAAEIN
jgi:hypothetical protein